MPVFDIFEVWSHFSHPIQYTLDRLEELQNHLGLNVEAPQLFYNDIHFASSVEELRMRVEKFRCEFGSIEQGIRAKILKNVRDDDSSSAKILQVQSREEKEGFSDANSFPLSTILVVKNVPILEEKGCLKNVSDCHYLTTFFPTMITLLPNRFSMSIFLITTYLHERLPQNTLLSASRRFEHSFSLLDLNVVLSGLIAEVRAGDTFSNTKTSDAICYITKQLMHWGIIKKLNPQIFRLHILEQSDCVLNRACPLISTKEIIQTPQHTLLQLCHLMDNVFHLHRSVKSIIQSFDYQYFEEAIPSFTSIAFQKYDSLSLLNLHNLIVRHAYVKFNKSHQPWKSLLNKVCYRFKQNRLVSLETIQQRLTARISTMMQLIRPVAKRDFRYFLLCSRATTDCPPLRVYQSELEIDGAVTKYIRDQVTVSIEGDTAHVNLPCALDLLFSGSKNDLMESIVPYLNNSMLKFMDGRKIVLTFKPSNWICQAFDDINGQSSTNDEYGKKGNSKEGLKPDVEVGDSDISRRVKAHSRCEEDTSIRPPQRHYSDLSKGKQKREVNDQRENDTATPTTTRTYMSILSPLNTNVAF
jgi:Protein of unknown function, DUF547